MFPNNGKNGHQAGKFYEARHTTIFRAKSGSQKPMHADPEPQSPLLAIPTAPKVEPKGKTCQCVACLENYNEKDGIKLKCGCHYDLDCLNHLVKSGCVSLLAFPPRCHGQIIEVGTIANVLPWETVNRYSVLLTAKREANTSNLFCAVPTCSAPLDSQRAIQQNVLTCKVCPVCKDITCGGCRKLLKEHMTAANGAMKCPEESKDITALRELGKKNKWKQCPKCGTLVERSTGCSRILCSCGANFCYECGSLATVSGTCDC